MGLVEEVEGLTTGAGQGAGQVAGTAEALEGRADLEGDRATEQTPDLCMSLDIICLYQEFR